MAFDHAAQTGPGSLIQFVRFVILSEAKDLFFAGSSSFAQDDKSLGTIHGPAVAHSSQKFLFVLSHLSDQCLVAGIFVGGGP